MSPEFGEALATFQAANQKELEILVAGGHSRRRAVSSFFLPPPPPLAFTWAAPNVPGAALGAHTSGAHMRSGRFQWHAYAGRPGESRGPRTTRAVLICGRCSPRARRESPSAHPPHRGRHGNGRSGARAHTTPNGEGEFDDEFRGRGVCVVRGEQPPELAAAAAAPAPAPAAAAAADGQRRAARGRPGEHGDSRGCGESCL